MPRTRTPRISLCMIVRDEEAMLPDCLGSVRGAVDEMIIVDTGSTDRTPEIARESGARVFFFAWCDDFAAARNEALRHARGDWVLALDADERLAPGGARAIRAALAQRPSMDVGMLRLHDARAGDAPLAEVLAGRERLGELQLVARLMRRAPDLAYVDPIHENVMPWLRRRGMRVSGVAADIVHLGATAAMVSAKAKIERNSRLLRARIARDPSDVAAYGYLAHELLRSKAMEEACELTERGWSHVSQATCAEVSVHRLALARAYLMIGRRRYREARETTRVARAIEGDNPDFAFLTAFAWEGEARYEDNPERAAAALDNARAGYLEALSFGGRLFAQAFVCGASTWSARIRLGTINLIRNDPRSALEEFDAALALRPTEKEALLGRAEATIELGDAVSALKQIDGLMDTFPDAWILAAAAVNALGHNDDTRLFTRRARALVGNGFLAPHRRERLQSLTG